MRGSVRAASVGDPHTHMARTHRTAVAKVTVLPIIYYWKLQKQTLSVTYSVFSGSQKRG